MNNIYRSFNLDSEIENTLGLRGFSQTAWLITAILLGLLLVGVILFAEHISFPALIIAVGVIVGVAGVAGTTEIFSRIPTTVLSNKVYEEYGLKLEFVESDTEQCRSDSKTLCISGYERRTEGTIYATSKPLPNTTQPKTYYLIPDKDKNLELYETENSQLVKVDK